MVLCLDIFAWRIPFAELCNLLQLVDMKILQLRRTVLHTVSTILRLHLLLLSSPSSSFLFFALFAQFLLVASVYLFVPSTYLFTSVHPWEVLCGLKYETIW